MKHTARINQGAADRAAWRAWTEPFRVEGVHVKFNVGLIDPGQLPRDAPFGLLVDIINLTEVLRTGVGTRRGLHEARVDQVKAAAAQRDAWQLAADAHWAKNPRLSKSDVARLIDKKHVNRIRQVICKRS